MTMVGDKRQIDHLMAATSTLRVRVDALLSAPEPPKEVVEAAISDLRALQTEMKPLAAVASEFSKRWQKQKSSILQKREAEVEYHLRQASTAQLTRMEEEAEEKLDTVNQNNEMKQRSDLEKLHAKHFSRFQELVEDWQREAKWTGGVRDHQIAKAIQRQIDRIIQWSIEEETRIMNVWQQELSDMMCAVHTLDEEEILAMEGTRVARCNLMENTVERQQMEIISLRSEVQAQINAVSQKIRKQAEPKPEHTNRPTKAVAKQHAKARAVAKKEADVASGLHTDVAVRYLDEAAALERARVKAFHQSMQDIGPELSEQLQDGLMRETEAATSKSNVLRGWTLEGQTTTAGLPKNFGGTGPAAFAPGSMMNDDEEDEVTRLQNEVMQLRQKAKDMMATVGRGDWRKEILDVADSATDGLRQTEAALAAGPLHVDKRSPRSTREALSMIHEHARDFSDSVLKEFTRMRNVKVALSCSRSKHVREAMQQNERNSRDIEDVILPAVSRLAHEVEVIREVHHTSKHGREKMPVYVIAAAWRRALLATYPVLKRLWEAAEIPDTDRKQFIKKLCMVMAVDPNAQPKFQDETASLEATLPAPDWAVGVGL